MIVYFRKSVKLIAAIIILGLLFAFSTLWYFSSDLPDYKILSNYKPPISSRVHSGEGQLIAEYALQKRLFIPFESIPKKVIYSFLLEVLFLIFHQLWIHHFAHIHCERNSGVQMHRLFAWMTYLNTTEDNTGSTNFSHYDISIKPETGKTLIWPAEWTHAHSGEVLNKGKKYIITGWMCFPLN